MGPLMPVTPLHYPFAFVVSKLDKRLILPGVIVGAVIPDIEVPLMWIFFPGLPDHLFLHSLIGASTVGVLLAIIITRVFYAPMVSLFFGVDKGELDEACKITSALAISCLIGVWSHLLLDYPMHWYNPILWPWVNPFDIVGPLVLFFTPFGSIYGNAFRLANSVTSAAMILLWSVILVWYANRGLWRNHWLGRPAKTPSGQSE
jgi:membrane-bound metal-dependent hydrolase YbcI (DUF457 family)